MCCTRFLNRGLYFLITMMALASCTSKKELVYLQSPNKETVMSSVTAPTIAPYEIQIGDRLYISVTSIDPETNAIFNGQSYNSLTSEISVDLVSYQVQENGTVTYPFVGAVSVVGKPLSMVQQELKAKVQKVAPQASVVVKLVNRSITVLGEVKQPGRYTVFKDQMTVFEALGFAGDITDFGSRTNVKIIRKNGDKQKIWIVDLTQEELLASSDLIIQPSDIVYVEPGSKVYGKKTFSVSLMISVISTFIALYATFIK
ncbi:polysaccharide export protein [Halosquirtibacter xylanolyticus]|uniref:polysaccharide biosynthesis/export family protein n=1 Tax=Halosquirtibacter xylanolyticus TaxID=3374599 RepID=UPI00374A389F|nr:polysaccharide export protein [Prolixibacteraceae bacterium]